ncbi:MAG: hypothetical protein GX442_04435 [Candidatus Riflebacteria bacterium]|nr:hypothetical protein [Candidatus Riflebacteria bacterium]
MSPQRPTRGFSLIEILIACVCFLVAVIPIINVFSFNIENARIIQARAVTFTTAQEILDQIRVIPLADLPTAEDRDLPVGSGPFALGSQASATLHLSGLPQGYTRHLTIEQAGSSGRRVRILVKTPDQPRADLELEQSLLSNRPPGGRP